MSQPHPSSELEQLIHALAKTLDLNSSSERNLGTIENSCVPINRLPPDVLSRILQHRDCDKDLVAATHVCKYWRSALISSPSLWTLFEFHSTCDLDRTLTYLERSKSKTCTVTIDIEIGLDSIPDLDLLQYFAPHIQRTRSFKFHNSHLTIDTSSLLLSQSAPSLEHLSMTYYSLHTIDNFLGQEAPLLRSAAFEGICPLLGSPFPLPSLTDLDLCLSTHMGSICISSLFGLFSSCPLLQKASIRISCRLEQDVPSDQTVSLDSLVECTYSDVSNYVITQDPFIPRLNLPGLKRLHVTVKGVSRLVKVLPHNGRALLSTTTSMFHLHDASQQEIMLSGNDVNTSFTMLGNQSGTTSAGWFSKHTYIPFRQIAHLEFKGSYISADFPFHLFKNLTTFKVALLNKRTAAQVLELLEERLPSPSLREIEYQYPSYQRDAAKSFIRPLINLAKERKLHGHKLETIRVLPMLGTHDPDPEERLADPEEGRMDLDEGLMDPEEELRKHVGNLQVGVEVQE